jgi:N-methylhydantoinase A
MGRRVYFGPERGWLDTPVLQRADLASPRRGPCVVEEYDATCVIPPAATGALDAHGNLVIELDEHGRDSA